MSFFRKKAKGEEASAESEPVQKIDGVFFSFNKTTKTLFIDGADQEVSHGENERSKSLVSRLFFCSSK